MKCLTLIILTFSIIACTQNKITTKGSETEKKQDIPFDEFDISDISLIRLIATPGTFDMNDKGHMGLFGGTI